jgi:hypothetical protein
VLVDAVGISKFRAIFGETPDNTRKFRLEKREDYAQGPIRCPVLGLGADVGLRCLSFSHVRYWCCSWMRGAGAVDGCGRSFWYRVRIGRRASRCWCDPGIHGESTDGARFLMDRINGSVWCGAIIQGS